MAGSLQAAIDEAQRMAWDESIGYTWGGDGNPDSNGYDCSAFVIRSLYRAGYNVPAHRVGTFYMKPELINAGFTIIPVTTMSDLNDIQSGDIVVENHFPDSAYPDGAGHTFFYVEDIQAYTDAGADSATIGLVHNAKVEASSTRGHTAQGDHRKNGTGAYWEVWCHAYYSLIDTTTYNLSDPNVEVYIARDPNGLNNNDMLLLAGAILFKRNKRRYL